MLNISKDIYACWNLGKPKLELPEAEIIPIGTSANEKRKIDITTKKYNRLSEKENIPLPGFTLFKNSRKSWGATDQSWLVIDPRGFLVRITNENLEHILHVTGITEGLIQEKCVWARDDTGTKMILIPVSSPRYIDAVRNTELIEGKVNMSDVQIGDIVILQNELVGTYMGVLSLYGPVNDYNVRTDYKPQVFLRRQIIEVTPGRYHHQADLKILKVIKRTDTPRTREESMAEINAAIASGSSYFSPNRHMKANYYSVAGMVKHVSTHAVPKPDITFEEISMAEAELLFYEARTISDFGMLMLKNASGQFLVDFPFAYASSLITNVDSFDVCALKYTEGPTKHLILKDHRNSGYSTRATKSTIGIKSFTNFYKIVKNIKDEKFI